VDKKPRAGIFVRDSGIAAGVEVTIDYNIMNIPQEGIQCLCRSEGCRRILGRSTEASFNKPRMTRSQTTAHDASSISKNRSRPNYYRQPHERSRRRSRKTAKRLSNINRTYPRNATRWKRWTDQEEESLQKLKKKGLTWKQIVTKLPGRTSKACRGHYRNLEEVSWAVEDDQLLQKLRQQGLSARQIAQRFPGHDPSSCRHRIIALDPTDSLNVNYAKRWTDEEEESLQTLKRQGLTFAQIAARLPGRTTGACKEHYRRSEDMKTQRQLPWTVEDDKQLQTLRRQGLSVRQIAQRFPGHGPSTCWLKIKALDPTDSTDSLNANYSKRWTDEEEESLQTFKNKRLTWKQIAAKLPGRTAGACRIYHRNLKKKRPSHSP
jgi:hypothetical protein